MIQQNLLKFVEQRFCTVSILDNWASQDHQEDADPSMETMSNMIPSISCVQMSRLMFFSFSEDISIRYHHTVDGRNPAPVDR